MISVIVAKRKRWLQLKSSQVYSDSGVYLTVAQKRREKYLYGWASFASIIQRIHIVCPRMNRCSIQVYITFMLMWYIGNWLRNPYLWQYEIVVHVYFCACIGKLFGWKDITFKKMIDKWNMAMKQTLKKNGTSA